MEKGHVVTQIIINVKTSEFFNVSEEKPLAFDNLKIVPFTMLDMREMQI